MGVPERAVGGWQLFPFKSQNGTGTVQGYGFADGQTGMLAVKGLGSSWFPYFGGGFMGT